jgi:hypothetical protein
MKERMPVVIEWGVERVPKKPEDVPVIVCGLMIPGVGKPGDFGVKEMPKLPLHANFVLPCKCQ